RPVGRTPSRHGLCPQGSHRTWYPTFRGSAWQSSSAPHHPSSLHAASLSQRNPGMSKTVFTPDHEWIRLEGDVAVVGITDYAQEQLGDLVFVELPEVGRTVSKGEAAVVVESVKAASDVYAPVDGEITAVNDALNSDPALVNTGAMGDGWLFKIKLSDPSQLEGLMDEEAYKASI